MTMYTYTVSNKSELNGERIPVKPAQAFPLDSRCILVIASKMLFCLPRLISVRFYLKNRQQHSEMQFRFPQHILVRNAVYFYLKNSIMYTYLLYITLLHVPDLTKLVRYYLAIMNYLYYQLSLPITYTIFYFYKTLQYS